jgi:hypothetical protein
MVKRLPPVVDLFKLVDACSRCSLVLGVAESHFHDITLREFYEKLQRTLGRFIFELKQESLRMNNREAAPALAWEKPTLDADDVLSVVGAALRCTVEGYDTFLEHPMPAHARAMIQRQRQDLGQLKVDLDRLCPAA